MEIIGQRKRKSGRGCPYCTIDWQRCRISMNNIHDKYLPMGVSIGIIPLPEIKISFVCG
jgi:hypothetical protein